MDTKGKYKVIITDITLREIQKIYSYISEELFASKVAESLLKKVQKAILGLEFHPDRYVIEDQYSNNDRTYHKIIIDNFLILYRINYNDKKVYILHMFYSGSNYKMKI